MTPQRPAGLRAGLDLALGLAILAGTSVAGELLRRALGLPVPAPVVGLLVLLAALLAMGRVPAGLRRAAELLLRHMNLFFIPAAVGVTAYAGLLREDAGPIAIALVLGTWASLAAGALTFRAVASRLEGRGR